jgi:hypothetical protein
MRNDVIGGADGPTSIFIAGNLQTGWLNEFGLIIVILLLIPNIIYAMKYKNVKNLCDNKLLNIIEQIGRYASMFLMIFNIGIAEFGFLSTKSLFMYIVLNVILLVVYWIMWITYFVKQQSWNSMALAIIPTLLFLVNGLAQMHILLIISAILFGIGHIYVTYQNIKKTA